ncbi:MAG: glycosyltransferase family 2 protein [Rhodospirillaceae bacterium]
MTQQPAISIVTLAYNKAPYLEECLRSVIDQDCSGVQYIVVDPGSTDGSRDILHRYRDRLSSLIEEPDDGPADGLNKGFAAARADIFGYLNGDDRFVPGALRYVVDYFAAHPDVDVLCGAIRIIDGEGRVSPRKRTADRFDLADYAAGICTVGQQATFFRRAAFEKAGRFNAANRIAWDGELLVDMALTGARFATVRKVLGDFRVYGDSITGSQTYRERLAKYHDDLKQKLRRHGVRLYTPPKEKVRRVLYKCDPMRHLNYLLVD